MKKRIAAFNWKLDPQTLDGFDQTHRTLKRLAKKYEDVEVIFAPPMPFLGYKHGKDGELHRASQTISTDMSGAHTGEVSAAMVAGIGCTYSIIAHSEMRERYQYDDQQIRKRIHAALDNKLIPIVCFGESKRDAKGVFIDGLEEQITTALDTLSPAQMKKVVLAYEPLWAIGANAQRPITEKELFSTIILIKNILVRNYGDSIEKHIKIMYGGSVKDHNAKALAAVTGVSGFLIGSASHDLDQLEDIIASLA